MKSLMFLFSLILLAALGCIPKAVAPPPPVAPPVIVALSISPEEITAGDSATLLWNVTGATSVSIDQGIGEVGAAGTKVISPTKTTVYTLTATNAAGSVTKSVVVTVGAVSPPPPPPGTPPVIVTFSATPEEITAGGSVTLLWNVTGATSVSIDPGIGEVGAAGTKSVSPATTTVYTLNATNDAGSVTKSVTVTVGVVSPPPDTTPPTVPILQTPADLATLPQKTAPWTFDWADSSDTESGIRQYQLQVYRAGQPPFIDVYVTTSNYSKTVEVAYPYISNWRWKVRAQNNAELWSAWSAERTFNVEPRVFYDFIDKAMSAVWKNGAGTDLGFGIVQEDGFARYHTNQMLDDGKVYAKVLETHPQWVSHGSIKGEYPVMTIPAGAKFVAKIGFINGATGTDGVLFRLTFRESGSAVTVSLGGKNVTYGGSLDSLEVDLSPQAGKTGYLGLMVEAGASSGQDWAAWAEAKIVY